MLISYQHATKNIYDAHQYSGFMSYDSIREGRCVLLKEDKKKYEFFPPSKNLDKSKLQISTEGMYSISKPLHAKTISEAIVRFLLLLEYPKPSKLTMTDGTACVGGNTLSFLQTFNRVIAVEKNEEHHDMLVHNLKQYKIPKRKIQVLHADFLNIIPTLSTDVVFIDPPWNRPNQKWHTSYRFLMLYLSDVPVFKIVKMIFDSTSCFLVALKCPKNFDIATYVKNLDNFVLAVMHVANYLVILTCRKRI